MDGSSPEHTMIAKSLKDLNRFIKKDGRNSNTTPWSKADKSVRMQLSFSEDDVTEDLDITLRRNESVSAGFKRKAEDHHGYTLKKHRDSVTGLDVCHLLREKDTELIDARAHITKIKAELSSANTTHTKLKLDYESELSLHRINHLKQTELIEELKLKLKNERKLTESLQASSVSLREENGKFRAAAQDSIAATTTRYVEANEKLREELSALREKLGNTEKILRDRSCMLDLAESESRSLREEVASHVRQAQDLRRKLMKVDTLELQLQILSATNKELEGRLLTVATQEQLASTFESSVQQLPDLNRQLTKLKEENDMYRACAANTRLLEEQVASASDQMKLLQDRCRDTAHLQTQLERAKAQLSDLEGVLRAELPLNSSPQPEEVRSLLRRLRASDQSLTNSITTMRDSVSSHERECTALDKEVKELRDSTAQQQQLSQRHVQLARRLQRKLILVSRERDSLKAILTSYEAEATMTAATAANSGRMAALEETVTQYRTELARLEEELDYYQHAPPLHGDKPRLSASDKAELSSMRAEIEQLQEQVSQLQQDKEVLEYRLEQRAFRGDYDPSQVNVLHMKQNPTSEAVERYQCDVTRLEEEVRRLKEQLSAAPPVAAPVTEKVEGSSKDTPDVAEADNRRQQELEKEVKSLEVKHQRLMEAFKSTSKEMREMVYRLLGYQLVSTGDNCYKLSNMYAESADDYFMFELASNGEIRLLSTDFSNSLEDLIDAYLNQENSYPAFLSAVTIDLFNRQTMVSQQPCVSPQSKEETHQQQQRGQQANDSDEKAEPEEEKEMRMQQQDEDEVEDEGVDEEEDEEELDDSDSGDDDRGAHSDNHQNVVEGDDEDEDEEEEDEDDEVEEEEEEDENEDEDEEDRHHNERSQDNAVDDDDDDLICLD